MKKVLILVEGPTEESFVRRVLSDHLKINGVFITPTIVTTKRVKTGSDFKGGIISYPKVRKETLKLLGDTSADFVTTMFDYYGLPAVFPGRKNAFGNPHERVSAVEAAFNQDINHRHFSSFFLLHEFEGLLFSSPKVISQVMNAPEKELALIRIRNAFPTPEHINDDPITAPSKRIIKEFPQYEKVVQGAIIANRIGLDTMRSECPHFNEWLNRIESI